MSNIIITDELISYTIEVRKPFFDKDQYGQTPIFNYRIHNLFTDENVLNAVVEYLQSGKSKLYQLSTYGGRVGIFKAITKKF